jgi:hypothetical protein
MIGDVGVVKYRQTPNLLEGDVSDARISLLSMSFWKIPI